MGSDWSWTLTLPGGTSSSATVERLLALAGTFGLSPHRPDGEINGFGNAPGREGEHRVLARDQLIQGLATGTWSTNLWLRSEVDIWLSVKPGDWDSVTLSLNSAHCRREPGEWARPFRDLHRLLTELWVAVAAATGAVFGRVEDEWSLEQIWSDLPAPHAGLVPPPPGSWPDWLSWSTYFDADRYRRLPPLPAKLGAGVRRTHDDGAVIVLLDDPAAVDPLRFARLHHDYRRAADS
ncbi:hypothetical protein AB5J62_19725 [Amycolatopsis sp. cg5]|uniref:hypothetical protein n=1 Tax=Amycolatopsis sp. cg5 TaxID=3238802 RepID=UPI0035248635